jgi:hypothetical protein
MGVLDPPILDASSSAKGKLKLAGDLSGTAAVPLVKSRLPTRIIATASSGFGADATTDGTADQVELNAAITQGGYIYVRKGDYYLSGPLTFGTDNVEFECEPGTVFWKTNYNQNVINVPGTNVTLRNFTFDGQRDTATFDNQGLVVSGTTVRGLQRHWPQYRPPRF